ncbi:hypothetical protein HF771_001446 [Salmonella enterica]|nr:hypothetical protein [Salmonella enterica]ECD9513895.1 hypothetical protein [Salmonella enterica subsp. diarizonae]ECF5950495.1 hypothetical protein [Salmonella enterica subsp. diarizonae]EDS4165703.1 hypothetical protein [Salmonella enterica]EDZ3262538.1 hypothetical protein [Salmonella enterica]
MNRKETATGEQSPVIRLLKVAIARHPFSGHEHYHKNQSPHGQSARAFLSVTYGQFVDIVKNIPLFFIHLKAFSCFAVVALMAAILPCF